MIRAYYIANTGYLLEYKGNKILIDGIHSKQVNPYDTLDKETLTKIICGISPFDNLNLLLTTHYHWDHLDVESTIKALRNQPNLKLFSCKQTIDLIKNTPDYDNSLDSQLQYDEISLKESRDFYINEINFSAISLLHDGEEYKDVTNFAYIIRLGDKTIFHCGDAKPNESNFENMNLDHIDIALLDFPYITLSSGRKVIKSYIKPDKIVVMHLPKKEKDTYNWLKTIHKVVTRHSDSMPDMILCENPNTIIEL